MNKIACGYCMDCTQIADQTARAERAEAELARQVAARVAVDAAENKEIARLRAALETATAALVASADAFEKIIADRGAL